MSLIPGIAGQKTELIDGCKADLISELTAGSGVQLQGRTSGVAIEAGKVGEVIIGNWTGKTIPTSGVELCSVSLSAGNYLAVMESSVTPSAANRVVSPPSIWTGTATVVWPSASATAWDWAAALVGAASSILYVSTTVRVTASGTLIVRASAGAGSTSADCRGVVQFIRIA